MPGNMKHPKWTRFYSKFKVFESRLSMIDTSFNLDPNTGEPGRRTLSEFEKDAEIEE